MRRYVMKATIFTFLAVSIFGSLTTATHDNKSPSIDSITSWPEEVSHGENIYVDAEITDDSTVESAWVVVNADGERLRSTSLVDSNNDGYYVSPGAFKAKGGSTYKLVVNACDAQGNCNSNQVSVEPKCRFNIARSCLY